MNQNLVYWWFNMIILYTKHWNRLGENWLWFLTLLEVLNPGSFISALEKKDTMQIFHKQRKTPAEPRLEPPDNDVTDRNFNSQKWEEKNR